ncbi:MAG: peptide-methionine (S)-S-oxide reductase, partial [Pseudomonadota bacterium]
ISAMSARAVSACASDCAKIAEMEASGVWPAKIVTQIVTDGAYYDAEDFHQDYLEKYPNGYTCHFIRPEWKLANG